MRIFGFEIINIYKRVRGAYIKGDNEAAYATYRAITGCDIKESWRVVKPWIKQWEGKKSSPTKGLNSDM